MYRIYASTFGEWIHLININYARFRDLRRSHLSPNKTFETKSLLYVFTANGEGDRFCLPSRGVILKQSRGNAAQEEPLRIEKLLDTIS